MVQFPLEPRTSRIIVEAIMHYPNVLEEVLIAASFLSANSPYILPPGEELEARRAHHSFRDIHGDFAAYLNLFRAFEKCDGAEKKSAFCKRNYLDERIMLEIENINAQLSDIVTEMKIPICGGGDKSDYLRVCRGTNGVRGVLQVLLPAEEYTENLQKENLRLYYGSRSRQCGCNVSLLCVLSGGFANAPAHYFRREKSRHTGRYVRRSRRRSASDPLAGLFRSG